MTSGAKKSLPVPISRALGNKTPQGLDSKSQKKKWPISGAESENEVGNPHGWPKARWRNGFCSAKSRLEPSTGPQGTCPSQGGGGRAELSASFPCVGWGLPLEGVEARRPPRKKSGHIHTSHTRLDGDRGFKPYLPLAYLIIKPETNIRIRKKAVPAA